MNYVAFFFFTDTATTEIYTLSLHDALPFSRRADSAGRHPPSRTPLDQRPRFSSPARDRKSTRLNSSHGYTSYALFCLKKKMRVVPDADDLELMLEAGVDAGLHVCD